MENQTFNWREHLGVHPAADMSPLMSEAELKELADDIGANGPENPIVVWTPLSRNEFDTKKKSRDNRKTWVLLDGRNRLDALARLGWLSPEDLEIDPWRRRTNPLPFEFKYGLTGGGSVDCDPWTFVISANFRRLHHTPEQKRQIIADLLKAKPEASDRHIAKQIKVDHKTVGKIRSEAEGRGEIPHVEARTDSKGRSQPAKRKPKKGTAKLGDGSKVNIDDLGPKAQAAVVAQQEISLEDRQTQIAAIAAASAADDDAEPEPAQTHPAAQAQIANATTAEAPQGRVITKAELMPLLQAIIGLGNPEDLELHDADWELYEALDNARTVICRLCSEAVSNDAVSTALEKRTKAEKRQRKADREAAASSAKVVA